MSKTVFYEPKSNSLRVRKLEAYLQAYVGLISAIAKGISYKIKTEDGVASYEPVHQNALDIRVKLEEEIPALMDSLREDNLVKEDKANRIEKQIAKNIEESVKGE